MHKALKHYILYFYLIFSVCANRSYFQLLIHKSNLQSCLCQYVKELFPDEKWEVRNERYDYINPLLNSHRNSGEYRGRTDDLLHAMQAL